MAALRCQANIAGGGASRNGGRSGGGRGGGGSRGRGRGRFNCDTAPSREQVSFASPFPEDPLTAIIGGGLSGLVCAHELARRGLRSVVFDTGEHGVGGRLATRSSNDGSLKGAPPGLVFDHAAQFFTATHPAFKAMVDEWERDGVVCRWDGPVGTLENGAFAPDDSGAPRYVARRGMRSLATHLAGRASRALKQERGGSGRAVNLDALVEVRRPQWVSDARYTRHEGGEGWRLEGRGRDQGIFDVVVIAHNGKCANRLAAPMGAPAVHSQLKRLKLSANWALLVAFASPVPVPGGMEGAFVRGSDVLAWAGNNSAKLGLAGGSQCWTLFSTQEYGRANKVPQENVPPEVAARVTAEMLAAFERSLGLVQGSLPPVVYSRTQLWGAALPINSPRVGCIFDPAARAGVCGDWVLEGGSMQAAALSGAAMAERIDASRGLRPTDLADLAIGLTTPLEAAGGEEIGQFPGGQQPPPPAAQAAAPQRRQQAPKQRRGQQVPKPEHLGSNRQQQQRRPNGDAAPVLLERPVRR